MREDIKRTAVVIEERISGPTTICLELDNQEAIEFEAMFDSPVLQQVYCAYKYPERVGNRLIYLSFGDGETDYTFFQVHDIRSISSSTPFPDNFAEDFNYTGLGDSPLDLIPPKWSQWIVEKLNEGYSREGVYQVLLDRGVNHDRASEILCYQPDSTPKINDTFGRETIYPLVAPKQCERWRVQCEYVEMYLTENFLDDKTCKRVIDLIGDDITESRFSKPKSYEYAINSSSYNFPVGDASLPDILNIQSRLSELLGHDLQWFEAARARIYRESEQVESHSDFRRDVSRDNLAMYYKSMYGKRQFGQRQWTIVIYLDNSGSVSGTRFQRIRKEINPPKGAALIWNNIYPSGNPNPYTLHAGLPAGSEGKIVLNQFTRVESED